MNSFKGGRARSPTRSASRFWLRPSPITRSTCSTRTAPSPAGMRAPALQGLCGRGDHRPAFSLFYTEEDRAAGVPAARCDGRREGRFEAEGWRVRKDGTPLLGERRDRPDPRRQTANWSASPRSRATSASGSWPRSAARRARSGSACWSQGVTDYAIYMLDPEGHRDQLERGRASKSRAIAADEIVGQHFSRFYTAEDRRAGLPQPRWRRRARDGRFESEGWRVRKDGTPVLGRRRHRSRSATRRAAPRLRQDHARHHRARQRRGSAGERPCERAPAPEDGGHRKLTRRRARFQQILKVVRGNLDMLHLAPTRSAPQRRSTMP